VKRFWWAVLVFGLGVAVVSGCASTSGGDSQPADEPTTKAPSETADDEPPVNTLKWTTASEVDNFGFDIYRSVAEDGPFEKITDEPLAGAGTTDEPQSYVFVDSEIDPTRDYYYYIESISLGGVREKFSPVIRSPAKRPAAD
jgi:hypothetical protein